jgi:IS5 family transposase
VEHPFGVMKRSYGYQRVRYFSLARNVLQLELVCLAMNLGRAAVLTS